MAGTIAKSHWSEDEGYDIHVLRNNQWSEQLDGIIYFTDSSNLILNYNGVQGYLKDININNGWKPTDYQKHEFIPENLSGTLNSSTKKWN